MVLHKHGERLYTGLRKVVTEHLEQKVIRIGRTIWVSYVAYASQVLSRLEISKPRWTDHVHFLYS
jgi:hypothetical protein